MTRLILLILIGAILTANVTPMKSHKHSSKLQLFASNENEGDEKTRTVCETHACDKISKLLLDDRNKSVDPCNDFYEYACGMWEEHNPIPPKAPRWSAISVFQKRVNKEVLDILQGESTADESMTVKLAKTWYTACMDTDGMEKRGLGPLISTLSRIGGWPMIMGPDEWDEQEYTWQKVDDHYMHVIGRNSFHDVQIHEEPPRVHIHTPQLPPGSYNLRYPINIRSFPSDEGENSSEKGKKQSVETTRQQYADYISKIAGILAKEKGTEISQERLDKDIKDLVDFQLKLIAVIPEPTSFLDFLMAEEMTLNEFQEWYAGIESKTDNSKIDWVDKITRLFDKAKVSVDGNLNLNVRTPDYIEVLVSLLDETSSRTIVNYIHWNFISRIILTTTSEMRKLYDSWKYLKEKNEAPSDRVYFCTDSQEMKDILGLEFVKRYFPDEFVKTASNMLCDIQEEVEKLIEKSPWMDDSFKEYAKAKLGNLKKLIGYPLWYKNSTIIDSYVEGLDFGESFYNNALSYVRYTKWKGLREISSDEAEDELSIDPTIVNAFFMPMRNALAVSAADFQSPLFDYSRPQAINYGIIGFVMSHEVNHGFDNVGVLFDKDGKFMGWLAAMSHTYDKKANCFVQQFNDYPVDVESNKKIKNYGNQTIGDNIADTMGLQAIFKAYQSRQRERKNSEPVLPDMENVTDDQLFFLSFANLWCEAIRPDHVMEEAKADVHSVGRLRVIGSVSNSEDFAKAYNCPIGSPMNPEKKCNIWK